jgi:uncharacterized protein (DUF2236 family)
MIRKPILPCPRARFSRCWSRAIAILPAWARDQLRFGREWALRPLEARLLQSAARAAQRLALDTSPAALACIRLGLPPDRLQRDWLVRNA